MSKHPSWPKTRAPRELKIEVWRRMALGDTDSEIAVWRETSESGRLRDRSTLRKLRQELSALPDWRASGLPEVVQAYRKELQRFRPDAGAPSEDALIGNSKRGNVLSEDQTFFSQRLLESATGIPDHEHGERSLALKLSFDADELSVALACKPLPAADVAYIEDVRVLKGSDSKARLDKVAELVAAEELTRVVTIEESPDFFLLELHKRGVKCRRIAWMGENSRGNIRDYCFGRFKELLGQRQLRLLDDAMLRAELGRITVAPSDTSPSYVLGNYEAAGRPEVAVIAAIVTLLRPPLSGAIG